jgi:hypothetical protein
MLTGVEILLERMKTNPEEFTEVSRSKWTRVLDAGWSLFTEEERNAVQDGLANAKREMFNGEVLRVLTGNDEQEAILRYMPSKIITPASMAREAKQLLEKEFDSEYAKKGFGY